MLRITGKLPPIPLIAVLVHLYSALSVFSFPSSERVPSPCCSDCRDNKLHTSSALNLGKQTGSSMPFSA